MPEIISSKKKSGKRPQSKLLQKKSKPILSYLDDFRKFIIRSGLVVLGFTIVAFAFKHIVFDVLILGPKQTDFITNRLLHQIGLFLGTAQDKPQELSLDLMNIEMAGQFMAHLMVSFIVGLMVSFPFIVFFLWRFIKPMLGKKKPGNINWILFFMSVLFNLGVAFGYFIVVPMTLQFFGSYSISEEVINKINFRSYSGIITSVCFSIGLVFELPIVIYFLTKVGMIHADWLIKFRKVAFVLFLTISAIITPPDVFSQFLVSLPLVLLYEFSIKIAKRIERKNKVNEAI